MITKFEFFRKKTPQTAAWLMASEKLWELCQGSPNAVKLIAWEAALKTDKIFCLSFMASDKWCGSPDLLLLKSTAASPDPRGSRPLPFCLPLPLIPLPGHLLICN